jgi:hypothetical protein
MNLWPDFENNQQDPSISPVHGRTRRLTEQVMLSSLRQWLLDEYVPAYCRALNMTRIFRRCYWVDALGIDARDTLPPPSSVEAEPVQAKRAGKGRKKAAVQTVVPPALQPIVTLAQKLTQEGLSISLYGLVLAAGSSRRRERRAQQNGTATPGPEKLVNGESTVVHASWLEIAPALLQEIEQAPAVFLLNPLGSTLFSYDDLSLLYQRTAPTEVCMLIAHKQISAHLLAAQRSPARATALTALLRSDRWKNLPASEEERAALIDGFLDLLLASMTRHFLLPVQRINLSLPLHPTRSEEIPYTLIFATRRQDSLLCMNDALCRYRYRVYEESHRGVLGEEWFTKQLHERYLEELQTLSRRIVQLGKAQRVRRWPDLRQQLLLADFGRYSSGDCDALLQGLMLEGEVRCVWRQPPAKGNGDNEGERTSVPGNEDTLFWS